MEKEYQILSHLQEKENTSQRQIATDTGLSLGTVNILLKRMIRKGLIKTQRLNARSLRYILTPKGLAEKAGLTCSYIKHSYAHIIKVTSAVELIARGLKNQGLGKLYLCGAQNEVLETIRLALDRIDIDYTVIIDGSPMPSPVIAPVIIVWDMEEEEKLSGDYQVVNILKIL